MTRLRVRRKTRKVVSHDLDRRSDGTTASRLEFVRSSCNGIGDDISRDTPDDAARTEEADLNSEPNNIEADLTAAELRCSSRPEPMAAKTRCRSTRLGRINLQTLRQVHRLFADLESSKQIHGLTG